MPGTEFEQQIQSAIADGKKTAAQIKKHLKKEHSYEDFDEEQENAIKKFVGKKRKNENGDEKKERKKKKLSELAVSEVSEQLQQVTHLKYLPRQAVLKLVWKYIKEHNLTDPDNKKSYNCDDVMEEVYGKATLLFSEVNSGLTPHLTKVEKSEVPEEDWEESLKVLDQLDEEKAAK